MKNISILLVTDSRYQGGSWWRSSGPFTHLRKMFTHTNFQFRWVDERDLRWVDVAGVDIVFMHRPFTDNHYRIFTLAHDFDVPVWLDIDDHLLEIPHDNATYNIYMDAKIHSNIIKMVLGSQVVTVSTNEMKRKYDRYRPKKDIIILKNSFDERQWKYRDPISRANEKRILWRGSQHHQKDLLHVKDSIIRVAKEFKDIHFYFVGFKPWYIIEEVENAAYVSVMNVIDFHKCLHSIHPDAVMVPLFDNDFNRCKSNIAALEGAMSCGMIMAPDWEEWNMPGILNYQNFELSLMNVCEIIKEETHLKEMEKTWEYIRHEYSLTKYNAKRMKIIDGLLGINESLLEEIIKEDQQRIYGDAFSIPEKASEIDLPHAAPPG